MATAQWHTDLQAQKRTLSALINTRKHSGKEQTGGEEGKGECVKGGERDKNYWFMQERHSLNSISHHGCVQQAGSLIIPQKPD